MWIILWNRLGLVVPLFFALGWVVARHIGSAFAAPERLVGHDYWCMMLGGALGGYANWRLGRHLNADEDSEDKHRLYFVPMEIWGLVGLIVSVGAFGYFATQAAPAQGPTASAPQQERHTAPTPAPRPEPFALFPAPPVRAPVASAATVGAYKLSAIIRSGSDSSRWLFEVVDPDGARHFARCGEQIGDWSVSVFTNNALILKGADGRSQELRAPRNN